MIKEKSEEGAKRKILINVGILCTYIFFSLYSYNIERKFICQILKDRSSLSVNRTDKENLDKFSIRSLKLVLDRKRRKSVKRIKDIVQSLDEIFHAVYNNSNFPVYWHEWKVFREKKKKKKPSHIEWIGHLKSYGTSAIFFCCCCCCLCCSTIVVRC